MKTRAIRKAVRRAQLRKSMFNIASMAIGRIEPGYRLIGVNNGQFSMLDLIEAIIDQIGPSSVAVSTWTQGRNEIDRVGYLIGSELITSFMLLIDRSFNRRFPDYASHLIASIGSGSVCEADTHAKFALIGNDQYRLCIRTSMNFNRNIRLEQFDIDDDLEIYDFFMSVINDAFHPVEVQSVNSVDFDEWDWNFDANMD